MTLLTVVTPSYNQGRFISKCIQSVKAQRPPAIEHIVLDNCSTDDTQRHLAQYKVDPGHVSARIIVERDAGQTSALNAGFRRAKGDVLCWLNTDEYYAPDALEIVAEYFSAHPEVDVLFGDCTFVDEAGDTVKVKREWGFSRSMLTYYGTYIPSCATFFRRRIMDDGHFLDESYRVCMDGEYYLRLAAAGYKFAHISRNLAYFTWHATNISSVLSRQRTSERRRVQFEYGTPIGPKWMAEAIFDLMKHYWIAWRAIARFSRAIQGGLSKEG